MESVWNRVNNERRELLLLKAYKDALSFANIADQPPVAEFELEDEPGSNLDDLQGYRSVLAGGGEEAGLDTTPLVNNSPVIDE
jgi:hypothetical protein